MNGVMAIVMAAAAAIALAMVVQGGLQKRGGLVWLENSKGLAMLGNGEPMVLGVDGGKDSALRPGGIYLANEARFDSSYYSEPLTTYTVGWRDPADLDGLTDFLAPPVQVGRMFEFKKAINAESFLSETDDERAIGADFKQVDFKGESAFEKTRNKGLTIRVDHDQVREMVNWEQTYTGRLLQRLKRNELRRIVAQAAAIANNVAKTWDATAGKDPDQDMLTELNQTADSSGVRANRAIMGETAWSKRALAHRAQNSAGGFASASLTPQALAALLGLNGIRLSSERYQSTAAGKSKIVPDIVLFFYAVDGVGPEDATNFKRFWTPTEGGTMYRVYVQQINAKFTDITVEHYSNCITTSPLGIRKITVS